MPFVRSVRGERVRLWRGHTRIQDASLAHFETNNSLLDLENVLRVLGLWSRVQVERPAHSLGRPERPLAPKPRVPRRHTGLSRGPKRDQLRQRNSAFERRCLCM